MGALFTVAATTGTFATAGTAATTVTPAITAGTAATTVIAATTVTAAATAGTTITAAAAGTSVPTAGIADTGATAAPPPSVLVEEYSSGANRLAPLAFAASVVVVAAFAGDSPFYAWYG